MATSSGSRERHQGNCLGRDGRSFGVLWSLEAFEAPLPASWSEHLDQERRIYFFNQVPSKT